MQRANPFWPRSANCALRFLSPTFRAPGQSHLCSSLGARPRPIPSPPLPHVPFLLPGSLALGTKLRPPGSQGPSPARPHTCLALLLFNDCSPRSSLPIHCKERIHAPTRAATHTLLPFPRHHLAPPPLPPAPPPHPPTHPHTHALAHSTHTPEILPFCTTGRNQAATPRCAIQPIVREGRSQTPGGTGTRTRKTPACVTSWSRRPLILCVPLRRRAPVPTRLPLPPLEPPTAPKSTTGLHPSPTPTSTPPPLHTHPHAHTHTHTHTHTQKQGLRGNFPRAREEPGDPRPPRLLRTAAGGLCGRSECAPAGVRGAPADRLASRGDTSDHRANPRRTGVSKLGREGD